MPRYFISMYTDGPATRWNVIDRQTQEWARRFSTEAEAQAYADKLNEPQPTQVNPLDAAWEKINALGGTGSTSEELAFIYGIERALSVIEELGGMDPASRSSSLTSKEAS